MSRIDALVCHCAHDYEDDETGESRAGHCPECGRDRFAELGALRAYLGRCPHCEASLFDAKGDFLNTCPECDMPQGHRFHAIYAMWHKLAVAALSENPVMPVYLDGHDPDDVPETES